MMLSVDRKDDCLIELKKEGYETMMINKGKVLSGWFMLNVVPGVIGFGVDLLTHNQGKHSEKPINATLISAPVKASK